MISLLYLSCDDGFFEQIPDDTLTIEQTFKYAITTKGYLANVYSYIPDEHHQRWPGASNAGAWTAGSSEAEYVWNFVGTQTINNGSWTSKDDMVKAYWTNYYQGINKAGVFMENVDKCAELITPTIIDGVSVLEDKRPQFKAEAKALRAIYYFYLFKIYGPVVIMEKNLGPNDTFDEMQKVRNSVDECVDYIVTELMEAAKDLPVKNHVSEVGRITKPVCHAVISQVRLFAASPLYNGNPDYAGMRNSDGKQLIPQTVDRSKWQLAAEAAKNFIDWYVPGTCDLYRSYTDDQKTAIDSYYSYRETVRGDDPLSNKELIFYRMEFDSNGMYELVPYNNGAASEYRGSGGKGATQEIVDAYFMANGLPIEDPNSGYPQAFATSASDYYDPVTGRVLAPKGVSTEWVKREPRFYADITFNGQRWLNTSNGIFVTTMNKSGNSGVDVGGNDYSPTGYIIRKAAPLGGWGVGGRALPLIRLAEIYLNYAEALNEWDFNINKTEILKYLNLVRERAGIPQYGSEAGQIPAPTNYADMQKMIRKERTVELAFENHRYFDVRRWKIAPETENGDMHGMNIKENARAFYNKVVFETRVFTAPKHYFFPIPQDEINRVKLLVQNTGWEQKQ